MSAYGVGDIMLGSKISKSVNDGSEEEGIST
jgi:hypothetical protein